MSVQLINPSARLIFNYGKNRANDNFNLHDNKLWLCLDYLNIEVTKSLDDANRTFILRGEMKWYETELKDRFKWITDDGQANNTTNFHPDIIFSSILVIYSGILCGMDLLSPEHYNKAELCNAILMSELFKYSLFKKGLSMANEFKIRKGINEASNTCNVSDTLMVYLGNRY